MVIPTDFNLQGLRTRAFKGFVQFQDPNDTISPFSYLRLKERQTANVTFNWERVPHYDDKGIKVLDPSGHSHKFDMTLKLTSDLIDDEYNKASPDATSDKKTLSYWMLKNELYQPIQIIFIASLETQDNKFLHFKFVFDPQTFGAITLGPTGGTVNIPVSGEVISISEVIKTNSPDSP